MARKTQDEKQKQKLIDELLRDYDGPESFCCESGLFAQLKKQIIERVLDAEMDNHLGYSKHNPRAITAAIAVTSGAKKAVVIDSEEVGLSPPRDRNGDFEPQLIPKRQKYFEGFNDKIIAMYARGMSVRDMQGRLLDMYGVDVSEGLISQAAEAVMDEVKSWHNRPLDEVYPIIFLDCIAWISKS